jgi:ABC-type multidrug transport system fused ATPase/permease subunit
VETLSDYSPQPCAVNSISSGSELGGDPFYAGDSISRGFPHIFRSWEPARIFRRLSISDLFRAFALTSHDASLSRMIFDPEPQMD